MSPKIPSQNDKISLASFKIGLAQSVLWDREILCDFIADKVFLHSDSICIAAEKMPLRTRHALYEIVAICLALRDHRNAGERGMKSEMSVNLDGIEGYVKWSKEELFRCIVHQVRFYASELRAADVLDRNDIEEVLNLCTAILLHDDPSRAAEIEVHDCQKAFDAKKAA